MLVLNTYKEQNTPLLMDYNGDFYSIDFEIEPLTEVHRSCSASINGEFYIFGGLTQTRQISKIVNCSLARIGDLMNLLIPHAERTDFLKKGCVSHLVIQAPVSGLINTL